MSDRPLLSPRTIAGLRTIARRAMQDTCTITTPGAPVSDGAGGTTPGTPTTRTSPCRVIRRDIAIAQRLVDDSTAPTASYFLWLPIGTPVSVPCQVSAIGKTFRAIWPPAPAATDALAAYILVGLEAMPQ